MIRAVLVDDEPHCLETLFILLNEYCPEIEVVDQCRSAKEAILSIHKFKPAVVFLDIEMPYMDGFELLEQFTEIDFSIIFTTSYDQYAIKAIHFSALEYLLKPINAKDLRTAVKKLIAQKNLPHFEQFRMLLDQIQGKGTHFSKIAIPTSDGFELIPVHQIIRCEADDMYTRLFLTNSTKIVASRSLKEIEAQLQPFSFFVRVHHSFIVNMNEVTKYVRGDGGFVIMSDGAAVSVSRSRKETILKWL